MVYTSQGPAQTRPGGLRSPDARLGNVNCKIIVRLETLWRQGQGVSPSLCQVGRGEDQDTPIINDNFWSFDFLTVKAYRMEFLDDILGFDLPSPLWHSE